MKALFRNSILASILAASLGFVCASAASDAHAAAYQISVYEDTFGPAAGVPYQNGIIQKYTTNPDGPVNVPQFAGFQYAAAANEVNGIAGDYKVIAEASAAHGGTAHAYAFGDGGFSGYSTSRNAAGILYPQQGYTAASATVGYNFQLIGPSSNAPIPVTFDATAYVKTAGTGYGFADLLIYSNSVAPLVDWELGGGEERPKPIPARQSIFRRTRFTPLESILPPMGTRPIRMALTIRPKTAVPPTPMSTRRLR